MFGIETHTLMKLKTRMILMNAVVLMMLTFILSKKMEENPSSWRKAELVKITMLLILVMLTAGVRPLIRSVKLFQSLEAILLLWTTAFSVSASQASFRMPPAKRTRPRTNHNRKTNLIILDVESCFLSIIVCQYVQVVIVWM